MDTKFKLVSFKDIKDEEVSFLYYPYIPAGKITFISGDPGIGKSFTTVELASMVSKGGFFPFCEEEITPGKVIIQNGEDGAGDTIKKRLTDLGANFDNIYMIDLKAEYENSNDLLLTDVKDLDILFSEIKPKLVIFDPITVFLGDIDMNSATKVRKVLRPISKLAAKYDCAIVFVIHRNKGLPGTNQIYRLLGSIDLGGIARSIITVAQGNNEKLFIHTKSNLAPKGNTLAFDIVDGKIEWLGVRADSQEVDNEPTNISPREKARNFIIEFLTENGMTKYSDLVISAKTLGIMEKTLNRARDDLKEENVIDKKYIGKDVFWYLLEVSSNTQSE